MTIRIIKDKDRMLELKASNISYTAEKEILEAEIIYGLKCFEPNYSFASTNGNAKMFEVIFPDSKIAKRYKQSETKSKYIIHFCIFPYLKKFLSKT